MSHDPNNPSHGTTQRVLDGSTTRGSMRTPSGSMELHRQGVHIQTNQQKYAGTLWKMTSNSRDRVVIAASPLGREKTPDERYITRLHHDAAPYNDTVQFEISSVPKNTKEHTTALIELVQPPPSVALNTHQARIEIITYTSPGGTHPQFGDETSVFKSKKIYTQSKYVEEGFGDESGWNWTVKETAYETCMSIIAAINRLSNSDQSLAIDEDISSNGGDFDGNAGSGEGTGHGMLSGEWGGLKAEIYPPGKLGNQILLTSKASGPDAGLTSWSVSITAGTEPDWPFVGQSLSDVSGFTIKKQFSDYDVGTSGDAVLMIGTHSGRVKEVPSHLREIRDFGHPFEYRHDTVFKDDQVDLTLSGSRPVDDVVRYKGYPSTSPSGGSWFGEVQGHGPIIFLTDDPDPTAVSKLAVNQTTPVMGFPGIVYPEIQLNLLSPKLNRMDGVIEALPIRKEILRNIPKPRSARGITCTLTTMAEDNQSRGVTVCQEIDLRDTKISPFLDMATINYDTLTAVSGSGSDPSTHNVSSYAVSILSDDFSVIRPFDDTEHENLVRAEKIKDAEMRKIIEEMGVNENYYSSDALYTKNGEQWATLPEEFKVYIVGRHITPALAEGLLGSHGMGNTTGERLRLEHKSASAGYIYGGNHPLGTDSIAFGGLKR